MFGEDKFFFDCRERERCEDTDVWLHRPAWSRIVYTYPTDHAGREQRATAQRRIKRGFDDWQWLCTQYSHRTLTVPADKLSAFSGVASVVSSKVQSQYLAGLWKANLIHDLL
jgi:hypothetical protein